MNSGMYRQNARAKRCAMGHDNPDAAPDRGYCASQSSPAGFSPDWQVK